MALIRNSKTLVLGEDGVLRFVSEGDYSFDFRNFVQVRLADGQTTNLSGEQYDSIIGLGIGAGARVAMSASEIQGLEIRDLSGRLDIDGVDFSAASAAGGFETSIDLDSVLGTAIDAHGAGQVAANLTVNGSQADAIKALWDYLDDGYTTGNNYYDLDLNANFVRLGVEYVNYLEAGGAPLTGIMAKFTADGADSDLAPERAQSMHDNLLGNLWGPAVADRFDGALEAELLDLIPDEYEARPYFDGNDGSLSDPFHDGARAFDYEKGWDRPDYVEAQTSGTVDARARDATEGDMLFGDGNSAAGFAIVRHEGAGVELAVKAKECGGADYTPTVEADGLVHYTVEAGLQNGTTDRGVWNVDFAFTSGISGQVETADQFDFRLKLDTDRTEATSFFELDPADHIPDNPASDYSEQNSWNPDFWPIDGDPQTEGVQPYDFGEGQFDIVLEAYDEGILIATNHIVVDVFEIA